MQKKILVFILMAGFGCLMGLQSCNVSNNNPTVPAPLPTNTPTSTFTSTPTPTNTPVTCNTHVVLSEATGTPTPIAVDYTYVDQFTLSNPSNFNAVTVMIAGASGSGPGNNVQVALYSDLGGPSYPASILFTSGLHQISSSGSATIIFNPPNFSLPAGSYWLAIHSSVQYQPYQNSTNDKLNYIVNGDFPDPFPIGASSPGLPWSYSLDTCHP